MASASSPRRSVSPGGLPSSHSQAGSRGAPRLRPSPPALRRPLLGGEGCSGPWRSWSFSFCPKHAVAQDGGPQPAPPLQELLGAGRERLLHPIAGPAFLGATERPSLYLKFPADQLI